MISVYKYSGGIQMEIVIAILMIVGWKVYFNYKVNNYPMDKISTEKILRMLQKVCHLKEFKEIWLVENMINKKSQLI